MSTGQRYTHRLNDADATHGPESVEHDPVALSITKFEKIYENTEMPLMTPIITQNTYVKVQNTPKC